MRGVTIASGMSSPLSRRFAVTGLFLLAAAGIAFGPRASMGHFHGMPEVGPDVERYLADAEAAVPDVRPGAGKRVVWAEPDSRTPTDLALVYLHGFTADAHEVEPLMTDLGRALGANVFFTRLTGHGRTAAAMGEASVDAWLADVGEAVAVGRMLGRRVVLIGTSTGGTLATWAALDETLAPHLEALVLLSPNFHPADRSARMLLWPWGGALARLVLGPERCFETHSDAHALHWTECHPPRALLPMMALVEHVRRADLERVRVPTFVLAIPDDRIVDADETVRAFERMGSSNKELFLLTETGDPDRHLPAGDILSPGTTATVRDRIAAFLRTLEPGIENAGVVR